MGWECDSPMHCGPRRRILRVSLRRTAVTSWPRKLPNSFANIWRNFSWVSARISVLYACAAAMRVGSPHPRHLRRGAADQSACDGDEGELSRARDGSAVPSSRRGKMRILILGAGGVGGYFGGRSRRRRRQRHLAGAHAPRRGARTKRARPAKSARRFASGGQNRPARRRELRPVRRASNPCF